MTNKDFYQATFSQVHPSRTVTWEEMKRMGWRKRPKKFLLVAAVACLLLALTGAAVAANLFGLGDLLLPSRKSVNVVDPETGQVVPGETAQVDIIGLSGFMNFPEGQALAEWQEFLDSYDPDWTILNSVGNTIDQALYDKYGCYCVYTWEMGEKLEEIAGKYGLKLHTGQIDLYAHPEALGPLERFARLDNTTFWTYMYEDGTCHFDGFTYVEGWGLVDVQFQRAVKGSFNEAFLNIQDITQFQEWTYETACGQQVLLAMAPGRSLVVADLPDCFVVFNVLIGTDGEMTRERLEALADCYDFTVLTPVEAPEI